LECDLCLADTTKAADRYRTTILINKQLPLQRIKLFASSDELKIPREREVETADLLCGM